MRGDLTLNLLISWARVLILLVIGLEADTVLGEALPAK